MDITFAQKIRELRKKKGLSVYDLATAIKATPGYISKIEARGEIPSPKTIITLAEALGIDAENLLEIAKAEKGEQVKQNIEKKYDDEFSLYRKTRTKKRS
jgi:transcriptional regulator with XRE-family HTH domain